MLTVSELKFTTKLPGFAAFSTQTAGRLQPGE
jgi:hypothetical protein